MSHLAKKPSAEKAISKAELEFLRQKAAELAAKKPDKAAVVLTDWLHKPAVRGKKCG